MKKNRFWRNLAICLGVALFLPGMPAFAMSDQVDVLIATPKPYDGLVAKIQAAGGTVRHQYKNIDAISATLPQDQCNAIQRLEEVKVFMRDRSFTLETPNMPPRAGYPDGRLQVDISPDQVSGEHLATFTSAAPDGYYPTEVNLMRASDFWNATGHLGEGVIIGIMDTGTANVSAISGRVIGGENFTGDGISATSPSNNAHGTWVATTAGANVIFGFLSTSTLVRSLKAHLPEAVLPNFFGPGIDGVPMVGPAPLAQFYALKIFDVLGRTSNSIILAAFDRTIELKKLADMGNPAGVNIRVLNGSFGGGSLFAGDDPFFAGMVQKLTDAGIVPCFSAGNNGPSGMTIGDPGMARNNLTVGATSIAAYEKVLRDIQFGFGIGALYRANNTHQIANFSSRGPTPDGRVDPDIVAPGMAIFAQSASGGLSIVSGTSFSAPNVAGTAALLISAMPNATPEQIRGALLLSANRNVLEDKATVVDQGFGFVDVMRAYEIFGAPNPPDPGRSSGDVSKNLKPFGITTIWSDNFSRNTGWLVPGQRAEFFVQTTAKDASMTITVNVTAELPPAQQNPLFGDDAFVTIQSAATSFSDYRAFGFVPSSATFVLGPQDLLHGLTRITINGDWTNVGRIKADVIVSKSVRDGRVKHFADGKVKEGETDFYALNVPAGATELALALNWDSDWGRWPTNDLDLLVIDPNGNLVIIDGDGDGDPDGLTFSDVPEKIIIPNPIPGDYTIGVNGFTVWFGSEKYAVVVGIDGVPQKGAADTELIAVDRMLPETFDVAQNYPNPFNPSTEIAYQLPEASHVNIEVFDVRGVKVRTLVQGDMAAGFHKATWDARSDNGAQVASGLYFYVVKAGEHVMKKRMTFVK